MTERWGNRRLSLAKPGFAPLRPDLSRSGTLWNYALAPVLVALATLVRVHLGDQYGPFLLMMFLPVLIVALRGGLGPGLFCTALSGTAAWVFVRAPSSLRVTDRLDWLTLIFGGAMVSALCGMALGARRRTELAQEALLHRALLLDQTYDAVLIWEWNGPITFWNSAAEELYGFPAEEALGQVSHDLLKTVRSQGLPGILDELERTRKWEGELFHTTRDGRRISVDSRMKLVAGGSGQGRFVVEANRDITARKAAQLELAQTQQRFRTTFQLSPLGKIVVRLSDDRIVEVNDAYAKIMGCPVGEIVGRTLTGEDPLVDPEALREVRRRLEQGSAVMEVEVQFRRKNGSIGSGVLYAETLEGAPDHHTLIVLQDVTTRQRAEDELRLANLDLQQFAFVAAHDLQEPARNVSTALGLFSRSHQSVLDPQGAELIQESIEAAKRMHRMIRDLLAFTRTGATGDPASPAEARGDGPVDGNDTLRQVLENVRRHAAESGAEITSSRLPVLPVQSTHFLQLLQNLIGNAIKYRAESVPPRIHIDARLEGALWTFSVADNGIGFDAEFAQQIFGVFKRLHQTAEYPGNGIGLAICERIVRFYGGRIWAASAPGQGSTFYFSLPAVAERAPQLLQSSPEPHQVRKTNA
jgi:PAS domain S-box-containing protein